MVHPSTVLLGVPVGANECVMVPLSMTSFGGRHLKKQWEANTEQLVTSFWNRLEGELIPQLGLLCWVFGRGTGWCDLVFLGSKYCSFIQPDFRPAATAPVIKPYQKLLQLYFHLQLYFLRWSDRTTQPSPDQPCPNTKQTDPTYAMNSSSRGFQNRATSCCWLWFDL